MVTIKCNNCGAERSLYPPANHTNYIPYCEACKDQVKGKPCKNSLGWIFLCSKCQQPILMDDTMIKVEVNTRTFMGQLNLLGHKSFHASCVPDMVAEYKNAEASFKKR